MFDSPIQFEEADKAIAERLPADTALKYQDILRQWTPEARQRAFFSARVMDATVLSELKRRVQQVVSGDMTSEQATRLMQEFFRGEGAPLLQRMGFLPQDQGQGKGVSELASTARLRLIFETNTRMAQEVGHYRQWAEVKEAYPYGVWHCGYAEEHRPEHLARDGKAYPFDHSIWTHAPPGGEFNCHCWREPSSAEEAALRGLIPEPMDSAFQPSSLGFAPSRGMNQPVQPGRRTDPELAEKAKVPPPPEQLAPILPEPEAEPAPAPQETPEQHAAKRLAQWQAAFEKRRDAWKAQCEQAIPVAPVHQAYAEYQRAVNTVVAQYTPTAAKLGKPPKLEFVNGRDAYYDRTSSKLVLGGFRPDNEWFHSEGCIRHEWGHWAHHQYISKEPGTAAQIKQAGDNDWLNIQNIFNGNMGAIQGQGNAVETFCQEMYGTAFWDNSRNVNERFVCSGFADNIGQMSKGRFGGGHSMGYYRGTFRTSDRTYNECIANIRSMMGFIDRAKVVKYFPELLAIVEKMGIL
jgi:hypothetical protein